MVEGYAGNGKREIFGDFVNEGTQVNYSSISPQVHVSDSHLVLWNEDAYQLWLDLSTLIDIRNCLPIESLRLDKIDQALKNFTYMVDFEGSKERLNEEIKEAREMLSPLMKCKNGSTKPMMSLIGHSHIDLAWLWDLHETDRKCARTFSNQLSLMKRYPEYRLIQSQPYLYERTKENYPSLYKEMVSMVKSGNFIPEGGMYVEADTNITGGESLIRQFIYGKKFFKDEFDIESKLLWLPDVFGYTAALPQIMKGCKIEYFSTQKILADYNGWEKFPYNSFYWKGIDGTKIKSFIFEDYTAPTKPKALIERFKN